jgi:RNA polymerase sigma-70 factor, ECF subfamily
MDATMTKPSDGTDDLRRRAAAGDRHALAALFARHRDRLRRLVTRRLDPRLRGRIDPSDVLQEASLDVLRRAAQYAADPALSPTLWLRWLTGQRLLALHRRHLGARRRAAGREVALDPGGRPEADAVALAERLVGRLTAPIQAAQRAELQVRVRQALEGLDPRDREVLSLRHFAELSNAATAAVLGLSPSAASNRYIRALRRLKEILVRTPGVSSP